MARMTSLRDRGELTTLEQQDSNLSQVEVDEMARLVCHIAAEVATDYTMPSWVVLFVELLLDESCNVLWKEKREKVESNRLSV